MFSAISSRNAVSTANGTPNFDRVARLYRWAEYLALGPLLQRTRTHFLPELHSRRSALVLGDGDGRFLAELLRSESTVRARAVDSSAKMLRLLTRRCAFASSRLQTVQGSALTITPERSTDLIVTHFFLDCLFQREVDALAHTVASHCHPGALWLVSDFQVPRSRWIRSAGALYIRMLYLAFRALTGLQPQQLPDADAALRRAGFTRLQHHEELGGLLYTELWRLQRSPIE